MRSDRDSFPFPPAIAAAHLRQPRHRRNAARKQNNYIAESVVSTGRKRKKRNRPGAKPGNANALTHGAHTARARALRGYVHALVRHGYLLLKLRAIAARAHKDLS
ncbi:MAG: hypothetical protein WDM91_05270 [Rhizomicrobium sp.]